MIIVPNRSIIRPPVHPEIVRQCMTTPLIRAGAARSGRTLPAPPPTDPFFANVVALLHFQGADASTTFVDEKGHTFTASGQAQIDTDQFMFGTSSALINGAASTFVSSPDSADYEWGTGDYTIECFWRLRGAPAGGSHTLASKYDASSGSRSWNLGGINTGTPGTISYNHSVNGNSGTGFRSVSAAVNVALNTWYYAAVTRSPTLLRLYFGSVSSGTATLVDSEVISAADTTHNNAQPVRLGCQNSGADVRMNGWLAEFRMTKGIARYTAASFPIPTAPFPDQ